MIVYTTIRYADSRFNESEMHENVHNDDGIHLFHEKWIACKCVQQQWNILANSELQWIMHTMTGFIQFLFQWKVEWNELCNTETGFIYFDEKCSAIELCIIIHNVNERCAWFVVQLISSDSFTWIANVCVSTSVQLVIN